MELLSLQTSQNETKRTAAIRNLYGHLKSYVPTKIEAILKRSTSVDAEEGEGGGGASDVPSDALDLDLKSRSEVLARLLLDSRKKGARPLFSSVNSARMILEYASTLLVNANADGDEGVQGSLAKTICGLANHLSVYLLSKRYGKTDKDVYLNAEAFATFSKLLRSSVVLNLQGGLKGNLPSALSSHFLPIAKSTATPSYASAMSILAMAAAPSSSHAAELLPVYAKVALTEKSPSVLLALSPFVSNTEGVFESVAPSLTMKLKAAPESSLLNVFFIIASNRNDIGPESLATTKLPDAFLKQIKSTKESVQKLAFSAFLAAVDGCTEDSSKVALSRPLIDCLSSLSNVSHREMVVKCLAHAHCAATAVDVVNAAMKALPKESNDANKRLLLRVVCFHHRHYASVTEEMVVGALSSAVVMKQPVKPSASHTATLRYQLDALNAIYEQEAPPERFHAPLSSIVATALSKKAATPQLEAIMALRLLSKNPGNIEEGTPTLKAFTSPASFLFSPSLLTCSDDALEHVMFCYENYSKSDQPVEIFAPMNSPACEAIVAMCTHGANGKVRSRSIDVLASFLPSLDAVPTPLEPTTAIDSLTSSLEGLVITRGKDSQRSKKEEKVLREKVRTHFRRIFMTLVPFH